MVSLVELQRMMNSQFCHVPTLKLGREWDSTTCDEDIWVTVLEYIKPKFTCVCRSGWLLLFEDSNITFTKDHEEAYLAWDHAEISPEEYSSWLEQ